MGSVGGTMEVFGVGNLLDFLVALKSILSIFLGWIMLLFGIPGIFYLAFEKFDQIMMSNFRITVLSNKFRYLIFALFVMWTCYSLHLVYMDIVDPNETRLKMYEEARSIMPW